MTEPEMTDEDLFEVVFGYVISIEASEDHDQCRAVVVYANTADYDPNQVCVLWFDRPALRSLLQTALATGNLLFFEAIKYYDAATPGLEQFNAFKRMRLYNSPQGVHQSERPRLELPDY